MTITVLHSAREEHVYLAGHEFGETHYIVAGSLDDAWAEFLCAQPDHMQCDHGDDPDVIASLERGEGGCDCDCDDSGRYIVTMYLWVRPLAITVDQFEHALDPETGQLA